MYYKENWEETKMKFMEYWARENHDRPLLQIRAPKAGASKKPFKEKSYPSLKDRWFDIDYLLAKANYDFENTFFGAEAFPMYWPNLGPDILAAFYGIDLEYGEDTSWAKHIDFTWEDYKPFLLDKSNEYYKKIVSMTEAAVADGKDKYLVGITDLHPAADLLVSMIGPEKLCMDMIDNPEAVRRAVMDLLPGFKTVFDEFYNMTTVHQEGTSNWLGVWHPGKWYVTSCDFNALISPAMYEEYLLDELVEELSFLDASIFHLDGPDALRHLDLLLSIDKLKGIQWVYGAGQPSAKHWIDVLKKIQDAGKLIHIDILPSELDFMLENLRPEGVLYTTYAKSQEEAEAMISRATNYS